MCPARSKMKMEANGIVATLEPKGTGFVLGLEFAQATEQACKSFCRQIPHCLRTGQDTVGVP